VKKLNKKVTASSSDKHKKIFVAMSGGVDSSVAALLLKKEGHDLVGCFIKGWYPPAIASSGVAGGSNGFSCTWKEDRRDAMRVCAKLNIPFITINAEKEYKKEVVDYMIKEYKAGRTPNPDVMCNRHVKFGVFLKKARAMGADYIATGHYARLRPGILNSKNKTIYKLLIARDKNKDQSYFLWTLKQNQLKYCLFPLDNLLKSEVREIAKKNKLITASKKDSQGVCFLGEFKMENFLKKYIKPKKGKVITPDKIVIGEHNGAVFYTIGQRHGFSIKNGDGLPYYVVAKDIKKNILIVAHAIEEKKFAKKEILIEKTSWISGTPPKNNELYRARIRYRQPLQSCRLVLRKKIRVLFTKPQRAVTSGQSLVIYKKQELIGGGIIR
jgi:tRNA-specific 2-thiouridylase